MRRDEDGIGQRVKQSWPAAGRLPADFALLRWLVSM
jgi:hypothetical protein